MVTTCSVTRIKSDASGTYSKVVIIIVLMTTLKFTIDVY